MYYLQRLLATTTLLILILPRPGQSCHPATPATPALSSAATSSSGTSSSSSSSTSTSCSSCTESQLTTLTVQDAITANFDGSGIMGHGPLALSTVRPTTTAGTSGTCSTLTTTCVAGTAAEIQVHSIMDKGTPQVTDYGNDVAYTLICNTNSQWVLDTGAVPGICQNFPNSNCQVVGYSCVTTTTSNG